ncbi:MAG: DNA translocase FtsK 4TM domain-containing protein [Mariprofundaceae bacterium]|nr:DNA translocase FtsK 4TM domain-containing protein [Mariprofundaceae bacterium]
MREALTLLLLAVTVALGTALVSYSPADPSFNHATDSVPSNTMGMVGAWLSDGLFQLFGQAAFVLLPMLLLWTVRIAMERTSITGHWRAALWLPTVIFLGALLHLHSQALTMGGAVLAAGSGGVLGMLIAESLRLPLGFWGLSLILLALTLSSLILATEFSIADNLRYLSRSLKQSRQQYKLFMAWLHCRIQRRRERIEHRERQRKERQQHIQTVLDQSQEIKLDALIEKTRTDEAASPAVPPSETAPKAAPSMPERMIDTLTLDRILDQVARQLPKAHAVVEATSSKDAPQLAAELNQMGMDDIPDELLESNEPLLDEQNAVVHPIDHAAVNDETLPPVDLELHTLELPDDVLLNHALTLATQPEEKAHSDAFTLPSLNLFKPTSGVREDYSPEELQRLGVLMEDKLRDYKIEGTVKAVKPGPVVIQFEYQPAPGTKVSRIIGLQDDLARSMAAISVRVAGNIPGKHVIGIEIPNKKRQMVSLQEVLDSDAFNVADKLLPMALGVDIAGRPVVTDLASMPHLLVAGTTGSGKSVSVNTMICSMLMRHTPETLRMIMVDPKMLELSMYNDIPHLLVPVVTNPKKAARALDWAVFEMERRYQLMSDAKVRNLASYNQAAAEKSAMKHLPFIVIVIDELADLMMVAGKDVEQSICRLAQKARAAGVHLILATQRPSVDVITGLIKANLPSRLAFRVSSRIDARTILDQMGAEQLLGMGDALLMTGGCNMSRVHGAFVTDAEVQAVTAHLKTQGAPEYHEEVLEAQPDSGAGAGEAEDKDEKYNEAAALVIEKGQCSVSMVQRHLRIGYNRASRIVDHMERDGIVSAPGTGGIRQILSRNVDEGSV